MRREKKTDGQLANYGRVVEGRAVTKSLIFNNQKPDPNPTQIRGTLGIFFPFPLTILAL